MPSYFGDGLASHGQFIIHYGRKGMRWGQNIFFDPSAQTGAVNKAAASRNVGDYYKNHYSQSAQSHMDGYNTINARGMSNGNYYTSSGANRPINRIMSDGQMISGTHGVPGEASKRKKKGQELKDHYSQSAQSHMDGYNTINARGMSNGDYYTSSGANRPINKIVSGEATKRKKKGQELKDHYSQSAQSHMDGYNTINARKMNNGNYYTSSGANRPINKIKSNGRSYSGTHGVSSGGYKRKNNQGSMR